MPGVNRVVQFAEFGGPEVLRIVERAVPTPGEGQVLVRVRAAGANPVDTKVRRGLFSNGRPPEAPLPVGIDVSGVVEDVAPGGAPARIGDSVLGLAVGGSFADYTLARHLVTKPADMPWAEAAAWPTVTEAAFRCLKQLQIQAGEALLIHGAAGSVGAMATQLAIAAGATVIGTASPDQFDYLGGLGATPVRYGDGWSDRVRDAAPGPVHAVLDTAGRAGRVGAAGRPSGAGHHDLRSRCGRTWSPVQRRQLCRPRVRGDCQDPAVVGGRNPDPGCPQLSADRRRRAVPGPRVRSAAREADRHAVTAGPLGSRPLGENMPR
jgi:D-arabinose 1-dehydrogenase-like Zn-dependent alcohol dehydrogenase